VLNIISVLENRVLMRRSEYMREEIMGGRGKMMSFTNYTFYKMFVG
jgi:hypothetical protein